MTENSNTGLVSLVGRVHTRVLEGYGYGGQDPHMTFIMSCPQHLNGFENNKNDPSFVLLRVRNGTYKDKTGLVKRSRFGIATEVARNFRPGDPIVVVARPTGLATAVPWNLDGSQPDRSQARRIATADIVDIGPNLTAPWTFWRSGKHTRKAPERGIGPSGNFSYEGNSTSPQDIALALDKEPLLAQPRQLAMQAALTEDSRDGKFADGSDAIVLSVQPVTLNDALTKADVRWVWIPKNPAVQSAFSNLRAGNQVLVVGSIASDNPEIMVAATVGLSFGTAAWELMLQLPTVPGVSMSPPDNTRGETFGDTASQVPDQNAVITTLPALDTPG